MTFPGTSLSLERIDAAGATPAEFARIHGIPGRPVILRGLFAGQPLARLSKAAVVSRFGGEQLSCVDQQAVQMGAWLRAYFDGEALSRAPTDPTSVRFETIRDYFSGDDPGERLPGGRPRPARAHQLHGLTPAAIRALYELPPHADRGLYPWCHAGAAESLRGDRLHRVFFGRRGHVGDLHHHRDLYHLFFHQVFGRKRIVLMPPGAAGKIAPVMIHSALALEKLSEAELGHFVAYASGRMDVLEPGETLFLPAAWWHFLDYLDDCMSVSMRFAEPDDPDIQFLLATSPDYRVRRVAHELRFPAVLDRHRADLSRLRGIARSRRLSAGRRYRLFMSALDELAARLAPDESRSHIELNDVVAPHCSSLFSLGLSKRRMQSMDLVRRVGYRLAGLA